MSLYTLVIQSVELCSCVVVRDMHRNSISLTIVSQWLLHTSRSIFFFFSTGRSIPVEKCSLKVIKSSIYRTVPPETASVFTTAVKMQSENVTVTFVCTEHIYKSWKHFSHAALPDGKNVILEDYSYYILRSTIVHKSDWQKRCHERRCAQAQV